MASRTLNESLFFNISNQDIKHAKISPEYQPGCHVIKSWEARRAS